jgi:ribosomal protein S18 acetylase RimI-like enzyme
MQIREMVASDIGDVAELFQRSGGPTLEATETPDVLARCLSRCPGLSQVAVESGQTVGAVIISEGLKARVDYLAVDSSMRRHGIGTKLVRTGLRRLFHEPNAAKTVDVSILESNTLAHIFWLMFGSGVILDSGSSRRVTFTLHLGDQNWLLHPDW